MSTEVKEKTRKNPWANLTPEQKAAKLEKLRAGKAAKGKPPTTLAELEAAKAEVLKLRAELDAKTRTYSPADDIEVCYEFTRSMKKGTEKIHALDDPRWEELKDFKREVFGTFLVRKKERGPTGDIIGVKDETCLHRRPAAAREMLERYLTTGEHVQRNTEVIR